MLRLCRCHPRGVLKGIAWTAGGPSLNVSEGEGSVEGVCRGRGGSIQTGGWQREAWRCQLVSCQPEHNPAWSGTLVLRPALRQRGLHARLYLPHLCALELGDFWYLGAIVFMHHRWPVLKQPAASRAPPGIRV